MTITTVASILLFPQASLPNPMPCRCSFQRVKILLYLNIFLLFPLLLLSLHKHHFVFTFFPCWKQLYCLGKDFLCSWTKCTFIEFFVGTRHFIWSISFYPQNKHEADIIITHIVQMRELVLELLMSLSSLMAELLSNVLFLLCYTLLFCLFHTFFSLVNIGVGQRICAKPQ